MSNYNKILQQFTRLGLSEGSSLSEAEMKRALDEIASRNARLPQFQPEVAQELWGETEKNPNGTATLRNFINVVTRAQGILKENIQKCEAELQTPNLDNDRRLELEESLVQYNDDLKLLSVPFLINMQPESRMYRDSKVAVEQSRASGVGGGLEASGFFSGRSSGIFADVPSAREESTSLKITFMIVVAAALLELIMMFNKHHFYNSLVYISIFAIVLLGYFDKYYMRFVLLNLLLSIIFDFIWIFATASPYWNPNPPTHHSTLQTPFLRFQFIFTIILMITKGLILLLFIRYRNNDDSIRKSVSLFGSRFEIDGRIKENNHISRILSGQGVLQSNIYR